MYIKASTLPLLLMRENLLQYIWHCQQFRSQELKTSTGESLSILRTGDLNKQSGPDFTGGYIMVDNVKLHGHIEVHVDSSSWYSHRHDQDRAYDNVILHVIWKEDKPVYIKGKRLPTLVLADIVEHTMLSRYQYLMKSKIDIPCMPHLSSLPERRWETMLEQAFAKRMEVKVKNINQIFTQNKENSEITAYQLLAHGFGFKLNSASFLALSEQVPLSLVRKNERSLPLVEALFFGQAGMLNIKGRSRYTKGLVTDFASLKQKHRLKSPIQASQWHFFRTRPANFPTLRIAQFANLVQQNTSIFDLLMNSSYEELHQRMRVIPSIYWRRHYRLEGPVKQKVPSLGKSSIDTLIINAVIPLLIAYGKARQSSFYKKRARVLLEKMPPEKNWVTRKWEKVGLPLKNAFQSQSALGLFHHFCQAKHCLSCQIGNYILSAAAQA